MTSMNTVIPPVSDYQSLSVYDRIENEFVNLYNYKKYPVPDERSTKKTGRAFDISKVVNLAVVDVDITKSLPEDQKQIIRDSIIEKVPKNVGIVQTGNGGLHIYCNRDDYPLKKDSQTAVFKCDEYAIDVFACVHGKQRWIVYTGSTIRPEKGGFSTYKDLNDCAYKTDLCSLEEVLDSFGIDLKPKEIEKEDWVGIAVQNESKPIILTPTEKSKMTKEHAELVVNGLTDIEIHNDTGSRKIDECVTLLPLFSALNGLINVEGIDSDEIESWYKFICERNRLTEKAETNWNSRKERYESNIGQPFVLQKIVKHHNPTYYNEVILPYLKRIWKEKFIITKHKIDMEDSFSFDELSIQIEKKEYETDEEICSDMLRLMRFIRVGMKFVIKTYNPFSEGFYLKFLTKTSAYELMKSIIIRYEGKKKITLVNVFERYTSWFSIKGVMFHNTTDPEILSIFQGFKYPKSDSGCEDLIVDFLQLMKEVIADNNEVLFDYIRRWIAFIIQNPGKKTEIAIVLKGEQGIGKNVFTSVISELFSGYSCKNVTDIAELTGTFNSIVEGKMLIILNELKNSGEGRAANFDALKSIISDDAIRINEKNQPRRDAENVANFIFVTNHSFPVKIETGDRRYVVCECSPLHKGDFTYFKNLVDSFTPEFYTKIFTYFSNIDNTGWNPREIPMTEAKEDIIKASLPLVDEFCLNNFTSLRDGMMCSTVLEMRPQEFKSDRSFQLYMKDKCDHIKIRIYGVQKWHYRLKPEYVKRYEKLIDKEDDEKVDDDI